jgi:cytochrome bd-type quinol oxidase subunit 2
LKIIDLSTEKEKINSMYRVISIISCATIISMLVFGVVATLILGVEVVGQAMVMFEIPPINVFPFFYSKPITWLMASSIAFWFSILQLRKEKIRKISR